MNIVGKANFSQEFKITFSVAPFFWYHERGKASMLVNDGGFIFDANNDRLF